MFKKLKSHLYVLQLLEYDPDRFLLWVVGNWGFFPAEKKGRLGWSPKARLIFAGSFLIQLIIPISLSFIIYSKGADANSRVSTAIVFVVVYSIFYFIPLIPLTLALFLLQPFEYLFGLYLTRKTARIIKNHNHLRVVGITGSFGKTSVKHILTQILSKKFNVVATPESYNKKLSIAQTVINKIKDDTQILIVEMGAYKVGEIAQICKMVKPEIAVITGITNQHLERFGSIENIKKAKNELIESLPEKGYAIFNFDNPESKELYEMCPIKKDDYSLNTIKLEIKNGSTQFSLFGQLVRTSLLGRHNVLNILAAVKISQYLGLKEIEIINSVNSIQPVPHRLELIRGENDALIIDDAYSSNTEGYKAAFDLVRAYDNYPKVLVTPGLVELGKKQYEENLNMAKIAADIFDYTIVVNLVNRVALINGLVDRGWTLYDTYHDDRPERWQIAYGGIKKDKIVFAARDLKETTQDILPKISRPGSLILLENDLPDIYR